MNCRYTSKGIPYKTSQTCRPEHGNHFLWNTNTRLLVSLFLWLCISCISGHFCPGLYSIQIRHAFNSYKEAIAEDGNRVDGYVEHNAAIFLFQFYFCYCQCNDPDLEHPHFHMLFGGHVNVFQPLVRANLDEGEHVRYIDITPHYLNLCALSILCTGHPTRLLGQETRQRTDEEPLPREFKRMRQSRVAEHRAQIVVRAQGAAL
jgi:hypothetical protein